MIARHDRNQVPGDSSHTVDGGLHLAVDHFVDFLLRMELLVNGRAEGKV